MGDGRKGNKKIIILPYLPRPTQVRIHGLLDDHRFSVVVAHRRLGLTFDEFLNDEIRGVFDRLPTLPEQIDADGVRL